MAVAPLELWSLPAAMALLAQCPGPGEVVVTRAVSLNQAGALLTILEQKAEKREWSVLEMDRLHAVVRVEQLLSASIDAYLPYLADQPFEHAYLDLLRDWSRDLENTAALVDRRYARKMKATGRKVRKFVVKSRKAASEFQDTDILWRNREIRDLAKAHKASVVLIRVRAMEEGDEGADDDDEEEEELRDDNDDDDDPLPPADSVEPPQA